MPKFSGKNVVPKRRELNKARPKREKILAKNVNFPQGHFTFANISFQNINMMII